MTRIKKVVKSTRRGVQRKPNKSSQKCFVIMPFGGYFNSYYESIYKKAIESVGLVSKRADDLFRPSNIIQDI